MASRGSILLVDDHEATLESLSLVMEYQGFSVLRATTAARARELLRTNEVDCVVMDYRLPDDGEHPWAGGPKDLSECSYSGIFRTSQRRRGQQFRRCARRQAAESRLPAGPHFRIDCQQESQRSCLAEIAGACGRGKRKGAATKAAPFCSKPKSAQAG
jgi:CheY-like chemotaxis protein